MTVVDDKERQVLYRTRRAMGWTVVGAYVLFAALSLARLVEHGISMAGLFPLGFSVLLFSTTLPTTVRFFDPRCVGLPRAKP